MYSLYYDHRIQAALDSPWQGRGFVPIKSWTIGIKCKYSCGTAKSFLLAARKILQQRLFWPNPSDPGIQRIRSVIPCIIFERSIIINNERRVFFCARNSFRSIISYKFLYTAKSSGCVGQSFLLQVGDRGKFAWINGLTEIMGFSFPFSIIGIFLQLSGFSNLISRMGYNELITKALRWRCGFP